MKFLDYEAKGTFENAKFIDQNGFFVGNYPKNLNKELNFLYKILEKEAT